MVGSVVALMEEDALALGDVFRDGVREVLSQPEFSRSERILELMDVLEQTSISSAISVRDLDVEGLSVVIGAENQHEAMHGCSVVVARYGQDGGPFGVVAGARTPLGCSTHSTIPKVRFLASVLSDLVAQI